MRRTTSVSTPVAHLVGPGHLKVINGHLAFTARGAAALRLQPEALRSVFCYGDVSVSSAALEVLFRHGIETAWLSPGGQRCRGRVMQIDPSTTLRRVRQHQALSRPDACLAWARLVVGGKIESQILSARHLQRHGRSEAGATLADLQAWRERSASATTLDELRGLEGAGSAAWFRLLGQVIEPPWTFETRNRRPPRDPVNALLSLGYTFLQTRAVAQANARGFEIYLGGLHDYRPGRASLACDLIEPLRVTAVDRWVLAVCNRHEVGPDDFESVDAGGIHLRPGVFGRTLRSWEEHWVQQQQESLLENWLGRFDELIRQWSPAEPTTPSMDDL